MKNKLLILFVVLLVVGVVAVVVLKPDKYHTPERIAWKDNAIAELQAVDVSKGVPVTEFSHDGWFSTEGLMMADGSWIVFRSICQKEVAEIYDLFIGRGSDGKWYYSTYHFCIGAIVIMEEQPDSLSDFVKQYALKEFDGRSEDCLLPTWPPED